jgi:hypothetical protein
MIRLTRCTFGWNGKGQKSPLGVSCFAGVFDFINGSKAECNAQGNGYRNQCELHLKCRNEKSEENELNILKF